MAYFNEMHIWDYILFLWLSCYVALLGLRMHFSDCVENRLLFDEGASMAWIMGQRSNSNVILISWPEKYCIQGKVEFQFVDRRVCHYNSLLKMFTLVR